jgi:hypothetical protein
MKNKKKVIKKKTVSYNLTNTTRNKIAELSQKLSEELDTFISKGEIIDCGIKLVDYDKVKKYVQEKIL